MLPTYAFSNNNTASIASWGFTKHERPRQVLNGRYPAELYPPSARIYRAPDPPAYPLHDRTVHVRQCGRICIGNRKINLSTVFAGQFVGIREVADKLWFVSFFDFDLLGFFDDETCRLESVISPSSRACYACPRYDSQASALPRPSARHRRFRTPREPGTTTPASWFEFK